MTTPIVPCSNAISASVRLKSPEPPANPTVVVAKLGETVIVPDDVIAESVIVTRSAVIVMSPEPAPIVADADVVKTPEAPDPAVKVMALLVVEITSAIVILPDVPPDCIVIGSVKAIALIVIVPVPLERPIVIPVEKPDKRPISTAVMS